MPTIFIIALSIFLSFASYAQQVEELAVPSTFSQAYKSYKSAVADNKKHASTFYAEHAYKLGKEKYGDEHYSTAKLGINWLTTWNTHYRDHDKPTMKTSLIVKIYEENNKETPAILADIYLLVGKTLFKNSSAKKKNTGEKYLKKAIRLVAETQGNDSIAYAQVNQSVGEIYYRHNNKPLTANYFNKALKIFERYPEQQKGSIAYTNFWLGKSLLSYKKYRKAEKSLNASLTVLEKEAPSHPLTLSAHAFMIQILEGRGKSDEATLHCQAIGRAKENQPDQDYMPVYLMQPTYPKSAALRGIEGWATVELTVDESGFSKDVGVIDSEPKSTFDSASIEAASKFRYAPQYVNGNPTETTGVRYRFVYQMAKR